MLNRFHELSHQSNELEIKQQLGSINNFQMYISAFETQNLPPGPGPCFIMVTRSYVLSHISCKRPPEHDSYLHETKNKTLVSYHLCKVFPYDINCLNAVLMTRPPENDSYSFPLWLTCSGHE